MKSIALGVCSLVLLASATPALRADDRHDHDQKRQRFVATLVPGEEVPAVSSVARGRFSAVLDENAGTLEYSLTFDNLEDAVQQAHIHFGQRSVNGGISIWLCSNLPSPPTPAGTQACPASGTVTGIVTSGEVVGPAGQGIAATEFAEIASALRKGLAYANVHSAKFPGGEIRGQIRERGRDRD